MKHFALLLFLPVIAFLSCKKSEKEYDFYCNVDGETMVANQTAISSKVKARFDSQDSTEMKLNASPNTALPLQTLGIRIINFRGIGVYTTKDLLIYGQAQGKKEGSFIIMNEYLLDKTKPLTFYVTAYKVGERIQVSFEFSMKLEREDGINPNKIHVSDGKFDCRITLDK